MYCYVVHAFFGLSRDGDGIFGSSLGSVFNAQCFICSQKTLRMCKWCMCHACEESAIAVIGVLLVLGDDAQKIASQYSQEMSSLTAGKDPSTMTPEEEEALKRATDAIWEHIRSMIPLWKIILIIILMACSYNHWYSSVSD